MMRFGLRAALLAVALSCTGHGIAQTPSQSPAAQPEAQIRTTQSAPTPGSLTDARDRLEAARRMIDSGQAAGVRDLLLSLRGQQDVDQIEVRFLLAMATLRGGDSAGGIALMRELLVDHPELVRARLELAQALFEAGSDESARYHFLRLRSMADLPAAVRSNVERFIDALNARRGWSADVVVALLPDSNIISGSTLQSVMLYGLPGYTPSDDVRQHSGIGLYVRGSVGRAYYTSPEFAWVGRGLLIRRDYPNNTFDDMIARADFGPRWIGDRDEFGVLGVLSERWLANETASSGVGARLEWDRRIEHWWLSHVSLEHVDYRWRDYPELDGAGTRLYGWQSWNVDATTSVHAGVELYRENLNSRPLSNKRISALIGANRDFGHGWSIGAQWRVALTRYDEPLAAFDYVVRRDVTNTLSFSVAQRTLQWRGLMPVLYLSFVSSNSSLGLFSYSRAVAQIGLSHSF